MSILSVVQKYFPNREMKTIHTYVISLLIHDLIVVSCSTSSLEFGCGHGGVMLFAGFALKYCAFTYKIPGYKLYGIDSKRDRIRDAENVLKKNRIE